MTTAVGPSSRAQIRRRAGDRSVGLAACEVANTTALGHPATVNETPASPSSPRDALAVTASVRIPRDQLEYRHTTAGGPGGQHANRNRTRVEIVFDVGASTTLSDTQKQRIIGKLGPRVTAVGADARSQTRNREQAEQRLAEQLRAALHVPRSRRATKPTAGSRRRRLEHKKQRSDVKRSRQRPSRDD